MQVVSIYAASFLVSAAIIGAQTKLNLKEEQKSGIKRWPKKHGCFIGIKKAGFSRLLFAFKFLKKAFFQIHIIFKLFIRR
jgi:hypothetical protein